MFSLRLSALSKFTFLLEYLYFLLIAFMNTDITYDFRHRMHFKVTILANIFEEICKLIGHKGRRIFHLIKLLFEYILDDVRGKINFQNKIKH